MLRDYAKSRADVLVITASSALDNAFRDYEASWVAIDKYAKILEPKIVSILYYYSP